MTKSTLLAATALTLIAATSTQAYDLALSNHNGTANDAIETPGFELANEITVGSGITGFAEFLLTPSTSAILPTGNAILTVSLGTGNFGSAVSAGAITGEGTCDPTRSVIDGGSSTGNTVRFLLSDLAGCDNANPISIRIPIRLTSATDLVISTNFTTEGLTPIDGGTDTLAAVDFTSAFSVAVFENDVDVEADVTEDPVYTSFVGSSSYDLGYVEVLVDEDVALNLPNGGVTATFASESNIVNLSITASAETGSFAGTDVAIGGSAATVSGDEETASLTITGVEDGADYQINVTENGDTIEGGTFTVSALLNLQSSPIALTDETGTGDIAPIRLGGTNFVAPWVALNSAANTTTLRISNNAGEDTGPLLLTIRSPSNGTPTRTVCDSSNVADLAGVPANGRIELDFNELRTCFGTDVLNADIQVTIQGAEDELTAAARLRSSTGTIVETSLGRLGERNVTFESNNEE